MTKITRSIPLILIAVMAMAAMFSASATSAQDSSAFAEEFSQPTDNTVKLKTRYWMPGAWAASGELYLTEIRREIKEIADAGYGGIELADVRNLTAAEQAALEQIDDNGNSYLYGSKNWQTVLKTVLQAAKDYEIQVDLTLSAYWPVASNEISPNDDEAAKELAYGVEKLPSGQTFSGTIAPESVTTDLDFIENNLEGLYAAKLVEEGTTKVIQGQFNPTPVDRIQYEIDYSTLLNITDTAAYDSSFTYTNSSGDEYILIAIYSRGSGQSIDSKYKYMDDNTTGTDVSAWVVDHLSVGGTEIITSYLDNSLFDDEIKQLLEEVGGYFFEDSLELVGITPWSVDMAASFASGSGYDIADYLPFVLGIDKSENYSATESIFIISDDDAKLVDRVRADFVENMSDMYIDNRAATFSDWANEAYGMGFRAQAYGAAVDSGKASAILDVPEGDTLTFTNESDRFRVMAAGRDMGGKLLLSNEIGAAFSYGSSYGYPYDDLLTTMNKNFAAGVNQNMIHGYSYAYSPEATWPGYHSFSNPITGSWSSGMPAWTHINDITSYINRTQMVLQQGVQKTDVAIYRQEYNASIWQNVEKKFYYDDELAGMGYSYQFFSRGLFDLDSAVVTNGVLNESGPGYKAMIIDNAATKNTDSLDAIPENAATALLSYAKAGFPLVFIGDMPSRSLYSSDDDQAVIDAMGELAAMDNVICAADYSGVVTALEKLGVTPDSAFSGSVSDVDVIHRSDCYADYYYYYNASSESVSFDVELAGSGVPCVLNTWTGEITPITNYTKTANGYKIAVTVDQSDTKVIGIAVQEYFGVTAIEPVVTYSSVETLNKSGKLVSRVYGNDKYQVLLDDNTTFSGTVSDLPAAFELTGWTLSVESWSAGDSGDALDTNKTMIFAGEVDLLPWAEIEAVGSTISGVGTYTTTFNIDYDGDDTLGAMIYLTDISDTYRVFINGAQLPASNQINYAVDLGGYVQPGENTIVIEVASLLSNALGVSKASGLMGDVTIVPYADVTLMDNSEAPGNKRPK